jgi:stage V sporulation protein AB
MLIRYLALALVSLAGGAAIASGYFAFISLIGIFPKLIEKVKGNRHYLLVECLLAYGATLANLIYIFNIKIPISVIGLSCITLFGGIFTGCLSGALAEVLNIFPIISRRFNIRRGMPYIIYLIALGKLIGALIGLFANGL